MTAPVPPVDLDQARQQGDVVLHEDRLYVYDPAGDPAYPWTVLTGAWDRWPESHIPAERPDLIAEVRDLRAARDDALASRDLAQKDALDAADERDRLRAKQDAVLALHVLENAEDATDCIVCGWESGYPCATVRALDGS